MDQHLTGLEEDEVEDEEEESIDYFQLLSFVLVSFRDCRMGDISEYSLLYDTLEYIPYSNKFLPLVPSIDDNY